jgi:hypothetical protein
MRRFFFLLLAAALSASAWSVESGLKKDETVSSFTARNVAGPFKGQDLCLACRFGTSTVIQVWVSKEDPAKLPDIASKLDSFAKLNPSIKVCVIGSDEKLKSTLEKLKTDEVPVAFLSNTQQDIAQKYKIHAESKNTVLVYKGKKVRFNYVDVPDNGWETIFEVAKALRQTP